MGMVTVLQICPHCEVRSQCAALSVAGTATNGEFVFAFLSEMKISFSWASVESGGLGVAVLKPANVLTASANDSRVACDLGSDPMVDLMLLMALLMLCYVAGLKSSSLPSAGIASSSNLFGNGNELTGQLQGHIAGPEVLELFESVHQDAGVRFVSLHNTSVM